MIEADINKTCMNCKYSSTNNADTQYTMTCDERRGEPALSCHTYAKWAPCSGPAPDVLMYGDGEISVDGLKYDEKKVDLTFLKDWDLALQEICKLSAFGAEKYSRGGWLEIDDPERLNKSLLRHYFLDDGLPDADSGFMHDVARAWNALSALQIRLKNMQ